MRTIAALLLIGVAVPIHAQEKELPVYRVEFNIRDTANSTASNRRYTMLIDTTRGGTFKLGDRVPVATGSFQPATGANAPLVNTQYTFVDTGVNVEARVREVSGSKAALFASIDFSTIGNTKQTAATAPMNPTIAQVKISIDTTVVLGKPTVVASVDDPASAHKLDVEATITRSN